MDGGERFPHGGVRPYGMCCSLVNIAGHYSKQKLLASERIKVTRYILLFLVPLSASLSLFLTVHTEESKSEIVSTVIQVLSLVPVITEYFVSCSKI